MSNFLSKIRERIATREMNKFDLSCTNITTNDFYRLKPIYTRELVPNSTINIGVLTFTRLAPLVKPMYGSTQIKNYAFFVPYRTIIDGWNEFITDTKYKTSKPSIPTITNAALAAAFVADGTLTELVEDETWHTDIVYKNASNVVKQYNFTRRGSRIYDTLLNLGYSINWNATDTTAMSALPAIAFCKLWSDWFANPNYNTEAREWLENKNWSSLTAEKILQELGNCSDSFYNKDLFTSAWDSPVAPNVANYDTQVIINDQTVTPTQNNISSKVTNNPANGMNGTPYAAASNSGYTVTGFTQYIDSALHRLTDYVKRHQLAGVRAMDRFKAQYGIELQDAKLNRSVYIGCDKVNVEIADVMNTNGNESDTQFALGEYAGKGIGFGKGGFNYKTDEFGQLIIISVIEPRISYYQGRDRAVTHINRLDFYTPEFDGLGVQAIRKDELRSDLDGNEYSIASSTGYSPSGVFGYSSRYYEYKNPVDRITGDFRLGSKNTGLDTYHFGRNIPANKIYHDYAFTLGQPDQYDRIFANDSTDYDHFYTIYKFDISATQPMAQMFDDYDWSEDSGHEQTISLGGTQLD